VRQIRSGEIERGSLLRVGPLRPSISLLWCVSPWAGSLSVCSGSHGGGCLTASTHGGCIQHLRPMVFSAAADGVSPRLARQWSRGPRL
jgi:hypothetical protein